MKALEDNVKEKLAQFCHVPVRCCLLSIVVMFFT